MSAWRVEELTPNTFLIQDGVRVVGSIARFEDAWLVEIVWSGSTGDLQYAAPSWAGALGFVDGVEKMLKAVTS